MLVTSFVQSSIWEIIPKINTIISLIAFALFVILGVMAYWFKSNRRNIPIAFWIAVITLPVVGVASLAVKPQPVYRQSIYRVRVTVLNPAQP
jgi:hypothetical protein